MKLTRAESDKKEEFALNLFKKLPANTSGAAVNKLIEQQFGSPLRGNRLYELKRRARGDEPLTKAKRVGKTAAPGTDDAVPQIVHLTPKDTPVGLLTRALDQMREAGVTNLTVSASTDRYVLVDYAD